MNKTWIISRCRSLFLLQINVLLLGDYMSDYSIFKLFGSVKIVQEVTNPTPTSTTVNTSTTTAPPHSIPTTTTTTLPLNFKPQKKRHHQHGRKNSFYASKQLRKLNKFKLQQQQQFSIIKIYSSGQLKCKSQKLLCLWPLPTITRYTILLSLIVSALNCLQVLELSCSSPTYVIHRLDIANLLLSPFLCMASLPSIAMFGWNVLILGLFEESLTHMLGDTRRFVQTFMGIVVSVCTIRQGIGYVFSKSTGWAVPSLFFSDALHECSQGLLLSASILYSQKKADPLFDRRPGSVPVCIAGHSVAQHGRQVHPHVRQQQQADSAKSDAAVWHVSGQLCSQKHPVVVSDGAADRLPGHGCDPDTTCARQALGQ